MQNTTQETKPQVRFVTVDEEHQGQRIDNFLRLHLKGVPKSMIYRAIRKGEVRVNKGRCKAEYKLQSGDVVRIPPLRVAEDNSKPISAGLNQVQAIEQAIVYEDDAFIAINKPAGIAVHGGSGQSFGVIEALRALRPQARFLELVHRLDRETSGVLLIGKKRSALRNLHEQLRNKTMRKNYLALVEGQWPTQLTSVDAPLLKNSGDAGERYVRVDKDGQSALTRFVIRKSWQRATLVQASPVTGRTHQIRVHCLHAGHPIANDSKYGNKEFDSLMKSLGLKRMFLHALTLTLAHPISGETLTIEAPLDQQLQAAIAALDNFS